MKPRFGKTGRRRTLATPALATLLVSAALITTACTSRSGRSSPGAEAETAAQRSTLSQMGSPSAVSSPGAPATISSEAKAPGKPRVTDPADTLHGHVIPDPYRWLEDFDSPRAQAWIAAKEQETRGILDGVAARDSIRARLSELLDIAHLGELWLRGERFFYIRRGGEQEQPVLYVQDGLDGAPVELIDPDELGTDAPVTLDWWFPSVNGELLAYGTSVSGSEMSTLRVLDVSAGRALTDTIPRTRLASVAWRPDATGFYYTRFPTPGDVPEGEHYFHRRVYYHELGADYRDDPLVFGESLDMRAWTGASLSTDGRFLVAYAYYGSARNDLYVKDLKVGGGFRPIAEGLDARSYGTAIGSDFYMLTRHEAPNGRIVLVDLENPDISEWKEIVPETEHSVGSFVYADGYILIGYLENAHERVDVFKADGDHVTRLPLPDMASISDWTADWRRSDVLLNVNSYLIPPTIIRHDLETGLSSTHMSVDAPIDTEPYVTRQVWYPSRDGTMVSMFLVHKRDIELDGTNPTILNGYGGFSVSMTPGFARNRYLWLEHGGVYAVPNLRGGGEYGEEWHRAGMSMQKQNTFDDFIAAAEWLIENGYTSPSRLAVWGGSNGGLLVAAFVTQRPDLAAAAIADVPLTDMTRFHLLYGGSIWTPEYGSPEDPEEFDYLYMYSPYHLVSEGTDYPAVYLTTAETDTRVHPSHALKMAARLEDATASREPILLRYERQAGHAMGARMSTLLEEYVDYYSFLFKELELDW